jgi:hypothetical protein
VSSDLRRGIGSRAVTRRSALVGLAVAGATAAGCTPYTVDEPAVSLPSPSGPRGVDRDVLLARRLLDPEHAMLGLLDATVRRHPGLAGLLASGRAVHAAHVELLEEAVPEEAAGSPSASPPSPGAATSAPSAPSAPDAPAEEVTVAAQARAAISAIARAEDRLAVLARRSAFAAESGSFARVLASLAAAAAQQGVLLRRDAPGGPQS